VQRSNDEANRDTIAAILTSLPIGLVVLMAVGLALTACEAGVFLGFGLPDNDACRDAASQPGKPIAAECLDSLGR
jgi:hypothetical protein